jgi:hypothetical protein
MRAPARSPISQEMASTQASSRVVVRRPALARPEWAPPAAWTGAENILRGAVAESPGHRYGLCLRTASANGDCIRLDGRG